MNKGISIQNIARVKTNPINQIKEKQITRTIIRAIPPDFSAREADLKLSFDPPPILDKFLGIFHKK